MTPPIAPKPICTVTLANLIKQNDYTVVFVDAFQYLIIIGQRCERAAPYVISSAERMAFGEVRTRNI